MGGILYSREQEGIWNEKAYSAQTTTHFIHRERMVGVSLLPIVDQSYTHKILETSQRRILHQLRVENDPDGKAWTKDGQLLTDLPWDRVFLVATTARKTRTNSICESLLSPGDKLLVCSVDQTATRDRRGAMHVRL